MLTIREQTGWCRPAPQALCQDMAALLKVHTFSYYLDNVDFQEYCKKRGLPLVQTPLSGVGGQIARAKMQDAWELFSEKGYLFFDAEEKRRVLINTIFSKPLKSCIYK